MPAYTVVYDGECGVCTRLAAALRRRDRGGVFEIVPSQGGGVRARFPWIPASAYDESVQVVRASDGTTWSGAAAIGAIAEELPRWRAVAWVIRIPLARRLVDMAYRWFARNRGRVGCAGG